MPKRIGLAPLTAGFLAWVAVVVGTGQPASAVDFRFEGALGIVYSDYDLSFTERFGPVELTGESNSALGGSGFIGSAAGWVDGVLFRDFSIGLEYLRTQTDSDLTLGLSGAGQSVSLDSDFSLDIDTLFLNAAWRRNEGMLHPYVGVGLGVSRLEGKIDLRTGTAFFGANPIVDEDVIAPSGQAFFGFDYDLTNQFYIGAVARWFIIDGRLFNEDQVVRELSAQVKFGIRF